MCVIIPLKGGDKMIRKSVTSSRILSVGWENDTLEIEFRDGVVYQYHGVSKQEYLEFMSSSSLGTALSILDKKHPYNRV